MSTNAWRTMELRWILRGPVPRTIKQWFLSELRGLGPDEPETRVELHLVPHGEDGLNIKFTTGRLEIKHLERTLEPVAHDGQDLGSPEVWVKWIWGKAGSDAWQGWHGDAWHVEISKAKWQRRIRFQNIMGHAAPRYDPAGLGFLVELTQIEAGDLSWWSLGFDVQPELSQRPADVTLHHAISWSLSTFPPDHLSDLRSRTCRSYARWLAALFQEAPSQPG